MFPLGQLVATPGVINLGVDILPLIARHSKGDWGDLDREDQQANTHALSDGGRIFSAYATPKGKVWVITEADRSSTCVLLPEEY